MAEETELDVKAFGMASGSIFAFCFLTLGIASMLTGWGSEALELVSSIYIGYTATPTGTLIGAFWGLIDGAILGGLLAWLYNHFRGRI